jgi:hypothetical protein
MVDLRAAVASDLGQPGGVQRIPAALDRELHALSLRVSRGLELDARRVAEWILADVGLAGPVPVARERITAAVGAELATLAAARGEPDRCLLLTATGAIGRVAGPGAFACLDALGADPDAHRRPMIPPLGLAVSPACFALWRRRAGSLATVRRWLRTVTREIDSQLRAELAGCLADLEQAVATVASDAIDHGMLLR